MTYPITCPGCGSHRVSVENFWADYGYTIPIPGREDRDPATPETLIDEVQGAWDALPLARDQEPEDLVEQSEIIALQNIARNEGIALRLRWAEIPPVLCRIRGYEILERTAKRWGNSGSVRVPAEDIGKRFVVVRIDP